MARWRVRSHKSALLLVFLAVAGWSLPCYSQTQAMKRGRDWMDLKSYDRAIQEFRQAIRDEPKNAEARYLIARCYHLQNDPLDSLVWIQETLSVAPNHLAALSLRTTIQKQGISYLSSSDRQTQSLGLRIVTQVPSGAATAALKSLMASSDSNIADASEKLMLRIDRSQARAVWITWLGSPDQRLKEGGAEKLWNWEKYTQAGPILREKYAKIFLEASPVRSWGQEDRLARQAATRLVEFGWPEASEILLSAVRDRSKVMQTLVAAELLAENKEKRAVPVLMERFSAWLPGGESLMGCQSPYPQLADALGKIRATEAVPLLKEAMSNCLSSGSVDMYTESMTTYLSALTNLTGEAWEDFEYWADGGTGHGRVIARLEDLKNDEADVRGRKRIDKNSPNAQKIYQWLKSLEPSNPFRGLGDSLGGGYVKVHSPREMKYYGEISDYHYIVKGAYILSLRATGDPENAWIVTDVTKRPCDRCGLNVSKLIPANIESGGGASPSPQAVFWDALIQPNGVIRAREIYDATKKKDPGAVLFTESAMNDLGYNWLKARDARGAIEFFKFNLLAYPNSANAYDSLSEAYEAAGERDLAIQNSEKALQLLKANPPANDDFRKQIQESSGARLKRLRPS